MKTDCSSIYRYNVPSVRIKPIPLAERSKAWVCSLSPAGIAGSNPAGGMDVCQVEVSATG